MKKTLLAVLLSSIALTANATEVHMKWSGHISLPNGQQMPLEFETFKADSLISANVRSPAQGSQNIPVTELNKTEDGWSFKLPTLGAAMQLKHDLHDHIRSPSCVSLNVQRERISQFGLMTGCSVEYLNRLKFDLSGQYCA